MRGVNYFDQRKIPNEKLCKMMAPYLLFSFINLVIINSFILWQLSKRNRFGQLTFRIALTRQLIGGHPSKKGKGRPTIQAKKCVLLDYVRLASLGNHMPKTDTNYRRCRKCNRKGQEKSTRYICEECDVPLYIATCYSSFHGK
ncbi:piggyBac transposable element-derived protein 4 [Trichonephila clavipes]|nr:piggyBac transposable element-derived protein 4 [Trichonephila clavipes]